jgi:flagellin-like protein
LTRIRNVRNTTKFKRSIKAISPVIATLLMIAIAVVASLVVYAWVTGYIGGSTTKAGKAIQLPSFAVDGSNNLHVYVQNVGQGTVQLSAVYVNDVLKASPTDVIAEGNTLDVVVTGPYDANTKLNIKVTTTEGTFMTATGTPGSNTNPTVSPTPGPSATVTPSPVPTVTPTPVPTVTPTPIPTVTPTPIPLTITLRPNGVGNAAELDRNTGTYNYQAVDEAVADGTTSYVYRSSSSTGFYTDTYATEDTSATGTINYVKIYIVCNYDGGTATPHARTILRVSGTDYYGTDTTAITSTWTTISTTYNTNPAGGNWNWAAINAMQSGVDLYRTSNGGTIRCTQVYVEVNYTP